MFRDYTRTPLRHITLRNCTITDDGMRSLLAHRLHSLTMWYCDSVTTQTWPTLLQHAGELRYLEVGRYVDLLKHATPDEKAPVEFDIAPMPQLQKLRLNAVVLQPRLQFAQLTQLRCLDLTACTMHDGFQLQALAPLRPTLRSLVLFNVWPLDIDAICELGELRSLDISTAFGSTGNGVYAEPNETLAQLVERLPWLTHLDISGTNLAGTGVAQKGAAATPLGSSDIPGLMARVARPLQFLGLYNTAHSACRRHDIPARTVSVGVWVPG